MKIFLRLFLLLLPIGLWGQVTKNGYLINVEKTKIYIDLSTPKVKNGTKLLVYGSSGYMIHPVTKQKIRKEAEACAEIQVTGVYDGYSVAKFISGQIEDIKVGMIVKEGTLGSRMEVRPEKDLDKSVVRSEEKMSLTTTHKDNLSDKIRVIVSPAEVNDVVGIGHFGGYVADVLMEQLMLCDKVRLLDRSVLNAQMDELNLSREYINPATAIQKGKIEGAQYIIQVTMQKPDVVNIRTGIPLASIMGAVQGIMGKNVGAQYASNAQVGTLKAAVSITTRVIDLQTSEVVFMCSGTGKSQGKSQLSLEYGALGGAELNGGAEGFKQTITGKAIQKAFITIGNNLNSFFNGNTDKKVVGSASGFSNYGQEMSVKGTKLYMGTEKLDKDGIQLAFVENPDLYFQYKRGKKQVARAWLPMVGGIIMGAVVMGQLGSWEDETLIGVGGLIMATGVGSGIYMRIAGRNKIKKAVWQYNLQQRHSYNNSCQLGFCLKGNGLGLCLLF